MPLKVCHQLQGIYILQIIILSFFRSMIKNTSCLHIVYFQKSLSITKDIILLQWSYKISNEFTRFMILLGATGPITTVFLPELKIKLKFARLRFLRLMPVDLLISER